MVERGDEQISEPPTPAGEIPAANRRRPRQPAPTPPQRTTRGRDAITSEEREAPFSDDPILVRWERQAAAARPDQLPLFAPGAAGQLTPLLGGLSPLTPGASLNLARSWYRRELEQGKRPRNTIESYCYDLMVLESLIGSQPINQIERRDIARYLGEANSRTTRKRRLTSVRRFFQFLIEEAMVLTIDPTAGYYPHLIELRSPVPLFPDEQEALMVAAESDEAWSALAIWLMLRLGLSRSELLALRRDHIDLTDPERPIVFVFYDVARKRDKERKLAADAEFASLYATYLAERSPVDLLFAVVPPTINVMVERVRNAAGINKEVTPQTLRHTFAVERAKAGADETQLLALLGLADDPRNRASVDRYLKLAGPPL